MSPVHNIKSRDDKCKSARALTRRRNQVILAVAAAAAAATIQYAQTYYFKVPYHTSALTGEMWIKELLSCPHPSRIRDQLGMHKHVFLRLVRALKEKSGLRSSRYVSAEEQVAIFLHYAVSGGTMRTVGERFQRSNDTLSK
jgi:hypothetical protein